MLSPEGRETSRRGCRGSMDPYIKYYFGLKVLSIEGLWALVSDTCICLYMCVCIHLCMYIRRYVFIYIHVEIHVGTWSLSEKVHWDTGILSRAILAGADMATEARGSFAYSAYLLPVEGPKKRRIGCIVYGV